jgi:UDP-glucose 4-epimerase
MLFVDNLSEFVHLVITNQMEGIFFPQNKEYVNTKEMVEAIAKIHGKKICYTKVFNFVIKHIQKGIVSKVFGDLTYEKVDLVDCYSFQESMQYSEEE